MARARRLYLLGPARLEPPPGLGDAHESRKGRALLAYLVLHGGPVARDTLAALLWPDSPRPRGRRNLTRELRALEALLPGCFSADYHSVAWSPGPETWVDAAAFAALTAPGAGGPDPAALGEAARLYRGELMGGLALSGCPELEIWLVQERELWRRRQAAALDALVAHHAGRGENEPALAYARQRVALDPWDEEAQQSLMALLGSTGHQHDALLQYERYRRALADELAAAPSAATRALAEQIRAGALAARGRPLAAAVGETGPPQGYSAGAIPLPPDDELIGRGAELATLEGWLADEGCRLVFLTGVAGVGKTALAARLARSAGPRFAQVCWHSLRGAPPFAEALRSLLAAAGQTRPNEGAAAEELLEAVLERLARRPCLVMLDDVEALFAPGRPAGQYRPGYEGYARLFALLDNSAGRGAAVVVGRELPQEFHGLGRELRPARLLRLGGLAPQEGAAFLAGWGLAGPEAACLVARCGGHPLALLLAASAVRGLFAGDVAGFLRGETMIFDELSHLLDEEMARLTPLEKELLLWLAVAGARLPLPVVEAHLVSAAPRRAIIDALYSLQRRSLVEIGEGGICPPLVVAEYARERLIGELCDEVERGVRAHRSGYAQLIGRALAAGGGGHVERLLVPLRVRLGARMGEEGAGEALRLWLSSPSPA